MRIKLDENVGRRYGQPLRDAGHDVSSAPEQGMAGAEDNELIQICRDERRCLVTLDVEFGSPLVYDPSQYLGIALVRLPRRWTPNALTACMVTLVAALRDSPVEGRLRIVQPDRVREYQQE